MKKQRYIYVVASATPSFTGGMIRTLTGSRFNHLSISFTEDLNRCYSFARRYRSTPFCGGFVEESPRRFKKGKRTAYIRVYRIPVGDEEYRRANEKCGELERLGKRTVYNNFSAVMSLVHVRVRIKNAYTCVEFITDMLSDLEATERLIKRRKWYSIDRVMKALFCIKIYSGSFPTDGAEWGGDRYAYPISVIDIMREEVMSNGRLWYNAITGACEKLGGKGGGI